MKQPVTFQWYREADFKKKFGHLTEEELCNFSYILVADGSEVMLSTLPKGYDAQDACAHYLGVVHYAERPLVISFTPMIGLRIDKSHQFEVHIMTDKAYHHKRNAQ